MYAMHSSFSFLIKEATGLQLYGWPRVPYFLFRVLQLLQAPKIRSQETTVDHSRNGQRDTIARL
jgi:hypothetical protein